MKIAKYQLLILSILFNFFVCFFAKAQDLNILLANLQNEQNVEKRSQLAYQVAQQYQKQKSYKKSVEYFRIAMQGATANQQVIYLQKIMQVQAAEPNYAAALKTSDELLPLLRQNPDKQLLTNTLNQIADYAQAQKDYQRAIVANEELLKYYEPKGNSTDLGRIYNNLGVIYRRINNNQQSISYLNKALATNKSLLVNNPTPTKSNIFTYINTGVTLLQLGKNEEADTYLNTATKLAEKSNDNYLKASSYNYLAMGNYLADQNPEARSYAKDAQTIAETHNDVENRLAAYKILALINESEDNYKDAQTYNNLFQELTSIAEKQKQEAIQKNLEAEIEAEKKESELKSLLAEKQKQEAALKQSELERQKQDQELKLKNNELALLKRNEELQNAKLKSQQLEQQRVKQLLELTQQKAETEKQKLYAQTQQQEIQRQRLIAEKERAEKENSQKALEFAETQKQLQDEKLAKEKQISYLLMGIGAIVLISLFFVARSLRQTKKLNAKLGERNAQIQSQNAELQLKQEEINTQNEELQQQQEEIMAQRDLVEAINDELSHKNDNMTNSITYASRIQRGMLPPTNQIITVLPEHFILYMPRDIVSGDFYWFAEKEEVSLLAAADCTGHGVPGAFMSMICIALLDSIVYEKNITSPDKVLERLSRDVIATLDQKNTNSHDGMDVVLLSISKDKKTVQYAGAKNPLFYVTNNEIHEIKGDKCPVGDPYYPEDRQFTAHTIQITSPTYFYALSDGYPDQFGGREKRKFGKKELRNILLNVHTEEMDRQRHILQENITQWMDRGLEKQIDDILVIGVKLG